MPSAGTARADGVMLADVQRSSPARTTRSTTPAEVNASSALPRAAARPVESGRPATGAILVTFDEPSEPKLRKVATPLLVTLRCGCTSLPATDASLRSARGR